MLEPRRDARVEARVLELRQQLEEQLGVAFVGRESERALGTIERTQAGPTGQHACQRRMLARDKHPMPPATVTAKFDVVTLTTVPDDRLPAVSRAPCLPVWAACARSARQAASLSRRLVVHARSSETSCAARSSIGRSARPIAGRQRASGCSSSSATTSGAASVAKPSHQASSGRARSSRHSSARRLARRRAIARASASLTSGSPGRLARRRASASACSGSSGRHHTR